MLPLHKISQKALVLGAATATFSLLLAMVPLSIELPNFDIEPQTAQAKPGGNGNGNAGGNGNGNAGGNGNANGHGRGGDQAGMGGKDSKGTRGKSDSAPGRAGKANRDRGSNGSTAGKGKGLAHGHSKDSVGGLGLGKSKSHEGHKDHKDKGISASALGSLNAAHASSTARDNAAPNSRVGRIASYEDSITSYKDSDFMDEEDLQAAAESLASAANKSIDSDVVAAVNDLLDIEVGSEVEKDIAERAETTRTGEDSSEEN